MKILRLLLGCGSGHHHEPSDNDQRLAIVQSIITLGQARLTDRISTADSFDARAMVILGTSGVVMALVVATRPNWGRVWFVPLIGALISAGLAGAVFIRLRKFDAGANLRSFYRDNYYKTPLDAHLVMLQDVFKALDDVDEPLKWKRRFFLGSGWALALTVVASVISLLWR